jgi:hypothetical protein
MFTITLTALALVSCLLNWRKDTVPSWPSIASMVCPAIYMTIFAIDLSSAALRSSLLAMAMAFIFAGLIGTIFPAFLR